NRGYARVTHGYVGFSAILIRKAAISLAFLLLVALAVAWFGNRLPSGFLPEEDQGYVYVGVSLPYAASTERTSDVARQCEAILDKTPGVKSYLTVVGFSLLSGIRNTYSAFIWVALNPWSERNKPEDQYDAIINHLNTELAKLPGANAKVSTPPAIQGVGASGGVTFILEDRAGKDVQFLSDNLNKFMAAARLRPELDPKTLFTTFLPLVPQAYVDVDRDKALKQGVDLGELYQT